MAGLNYERTILAATSLGLAQRAFDDALAYAKERRQFGRPIGSFQAISHRFAELATEIAVLIEQIVQGASNKEAGRSLGISPRTVEVHRARIMEKLRARNTADLMRIVLRDGERI